VLVCSSETVSRKVKGWAAANWDNDAKHALFNLYDRAADRKNWVFRIPPHDSVFYRFSVFRATLLNRDRPRARVYHGGGRVSAAGEVGLRPGALAQVRLPPEQ
jgi:hypothetical protein